MTKQEMERMRRRIERDALMSTEVRCYEQQRQTKRGIIVSYSYGLTVTDGRTGYSYVVDQYTPTRPGR